MPLTPRIHVITLGVSDLGRAVSFYRDGLGLQTEVSLCVTNWAFSRRTRRVVCASSAPIDGCVT